jgi:hypothetical protein
VILAAAAEIFVDRIRRAKKKGARNGNQTGFREDELVLRKQKVNGEWVETLFPRVGGRLRLAHEGNGKLSIQTDVVRFDDSLAVVKATVTTEKGCFCGFGTASLKETNV